MNAAASATKRGASTHGRTVNHGSRLKGGHVCSWSTNCVSPSTGLTWMTRGPSSSTSTWRPVTSLALIRYCVASYGGAGELDAGRSSGQRPSRVAACAAAQRYWIVYPAGSSAVPPHGVALSTSAPLPSSTAATPASEPAAASAASRWAGAASAPLPSDPPASGSPAEATTAGAGPSAANSSPTARRTGTIRRLGPEPADRLDRPAPSAGAVCTVCSVQRVHSPPGWRANTVYRYEQSVGSPSSRNAPVTP
ncbi:MAG: hypothetical protein BWY94_02001 [Actinobacteria bacterium ADurb.BinA094]|nr:MAG: hypothetical protein BWY94_02001 [Actinobacteria bacterium ADurb.BinA094]